MGENSDNEQRSSSENNYFEDESASDEVSNNTEEGDEKTMRLQIGDDVLTVFPEDNSSADALIELISQKPLTIKMQDYGNMEKVGPIGT
jgi:hypothetical protein